MPRHAMEVLTESMFYMLMALSQQPMRGIDIAQWVEQKTRGRVKLGPATLYTILGKFEKEKFIREVEVQGRMRTYSITARGLEAYRGEVERLRACLADAEGGEVDAGE